MTYMAKTAAIIRMPSAPTVSAKTLVSPCAAPVTVGGRTSRAVFSTNLAASPMTAVGLRLKEIVAAGNWLRCAMFCGPTVSFQRATVLNGTSDFPSSVRM